MKKIAAFVLARGGSKGLPGKNIRLFAGKPLLAWSVLAAQQTGVIDRIIVSTDDDAIGQAGVRAGAEFFKRSNALSTDLALPKDAIRHHVDELEEEGYSPDVIVLLQPTSPLRAPSDIIACIDAVKDGADSAVTFTTAASNPHRAWKIIDGAPMPFIDGANPWAPRQALPEAFAINGAVYVARTKALLTDPSPSFIVGNARAVVMPPERSVDIDTLLDFKIAETVKAFLEQQADR